MKNHVIKEKNNEPVCVSAREVKIITFWLIKRRPDLEWANCELFQLPFNDHEGFIYAVNNGNIYRLSYTRFRFFKIDFSSFCRILQITSKELRRQMFKKCHVYAGIKCYVSNSSVSYVMN